MHFILHFKGWWTVICMFNNALYDYLNLILAFSKIIPFGTGLSQLILKLPNKHILWPMGTKFGITFIFTVAWAQRTLLAVSEIAYSLLGFLIWMRFRIQPKVFSEICTGHSKWWSEGHLWLWNPFRTMYSELVCISLSSMTCYDAIIIRF